MIRRMVLSAAAGVAAIAGLSLTPASADARPCEPVPVCRPVHVVRHHHHPLFGVRRCEPVRPVVVVRPVTPPPVVVAPVCPTPAPVVVPCPR